MKKLKNTTELYLKIYFQIRFYLFLSSLHYLIFNYNFTFHTHLWDRVFLLMYIFALILFVFSGLYCFLLSRIITKDLYKKTVFYINSILMILSLCLFIYAGFFTQNNSLEIIVFILLPFLSFNIISWLVTKRAINKNIIISKKFIKNTAIWWGIFSLLFFVFWTLQPYNRIIIDDKYLNNSNSEISQWWLELEAFNKKYSQDELLSLFYDCRTWNLESDCLNNPYFWDEFTLEYESLKQIKKETPDIYQNINAHDIYKNLVYNNLTKKVYVDLLEIEQEVQKLSKYSYYNRWQDFYNSFNDYSYWTILELYRLLIDYNMYFAQYFKVNNLLNNYYIFVKAYNSWSTFEIWYSQIQFYFSQLEKYGYSDIRYPEKLSYDKNIYISSFTSKHININNDFLINLPDILFIFNKQQHINYYYYHLKQIQNNDFVHAYKNPLFYYVWNNLLLKISQDFKYYHNDFKDNLEFFDYIQKKSEY